MSPGRAAPRSRTVARASNSLGPAPGLHEAGATIVFLTGRRRSRRKTLLVGGRAIGSSATISLAHCRPHESHSLRSRRRPASELRVRLSDTVRGAGARPGDAGLVANAHRRRLAALRSDDRCRPQRRHLRHRALPWIQHPDGQAGARRHAAVAGAVQQSRHPRAGSLARRRPVRRHPGGRLPRGRQQPHAQRLRDVEV